MALSRANAENSLHDSKWMSGKSLKIYVETALCGVPARNPSLCGNEGQHPNIRDVRRLFSSLKRIQWRTTNVPNVYSVVDRDAVFLGVCR